MKPAGPRTSDKKNPGRKNIDRNAMGDSRTEDEKGRCERKGPISTKESSEGSGRGGQVRECLISKDLAPGAPAYWATSKKSQERRRAFKKASYQARHAANSLCQNSEGASAEGGCRSREKPPSDWGLHRNYGNWGKKRQPQWEKAGVTKPAACRGGHPGFRQKGHEKEKPLGFQIYLRLPGPRGLVGTVRQSTPQSIP